MTNRQDLINCSIIFAYCLFFVALRLVLPHSLSNDEAEQIFAASDYVLGYPKQAPLYSWILKTISYGTELNVISLTIARYFFYFVFITSFYYTNRLWFKPSQALIVTSSLLYFVTYTYDFNRDLTHTILVTVFAALSYQQYFYLLAKPNSIHYLLLGLFFGLGVITKYNFVFIASAIVLAALSNKLGRTRFFSSKTFISIGAALSISLPHFIWLFTHKAKAIKYALSRGDTEKSFSLLNSIKLLFFTYYEIVIVLFILFMLWFSFINKEQNNDIQPIKTNLIQISFYGILLPAIIIVTFGLNKFFAKWLSPVMFSIIPVSFMNIDFDKFSNLIRRQTILHYILITVIISTITIVSLVGGFAPDLIGKIRSSQYPYETIYAKLIDELKKKNLDPNHLTIITSRDHLLLGNMQYIFSKSKYPIQITRVKNYQDSGEQKILIWNQSQNPMPKAFYKHFPQAKEQEPISALYINSHKNFYKLGWAIVD